MSRKIVALAALAFTGAVLVVPDPSFARGGGIGGGFHGGLRAPFIARNVHTNVFRPAIRTNAHVRPAVRTNARQVRLPAAPRLGPRLARTTIWAPFGHLGRRHHRGVHSGWIFPVTTSDDSAYIGTPYDPGEAIPVYGPVPAAGEADPPAPQPMPRLSSTRDDNQDACRSERVTVPAAEGEREITVVRC